MALNIVAKSVVLVNLGTIRDVEGHEQALTRPSVVLRSLNSLHLSTIVPLSTNKPPRAAGAVIKVAKGTASLKSGSYVLIHQIRTISHRRIAHTIGQLPSGKFDEVKQAVKSFLDL